MMHVHSVMGTPRRCAAGGRLVRATDSVPVPLRGGDRINLGAGQELEVRFGT